MNEIDTRGRSCPEPVLMTKKALKKGLPLKVIADSMTPVQNITRFAVNNGYKVSHKPVGEDFEIRIEVK